MIVTHAQRAIKSIYAKVVGRSLEMSFSETCGLVAFSSQGAWENGEQTTGGGCVTPSMGGLTLAASPQLLEAGGGGRRCRQTARPRRWQEVGGTRGAGPWDAERPTGAGNLLRCRCIELLEERRNNGSAPRATNKALR
jgi:hypothetical protein